jgi:hypothetical protein
MDKGADEFMAEWLKRYPNACPWSQDIRIADSNSVKELFKYSTKIIDTYKSENPEENPENKEVNIEIYPEALDNIMRALYGRRILQPFGNIKKVNDEVEELQSQEYLDIPYHIEAVWFWTGQDWYTDEHPEGLTGYTPPPFCNSRPFFTRCANKFFLGFPSYVPQGYCRLSNRYDAPVCIRTRTANLRYFCRQNKIRFVILPFRH